MKWTREELNMAVKEYHKMSLLEANEENFIKKHIYEKLSIKSGRSPAAWEYRMQNISYVYQSMGRKYVTGLQPAKHVGANVFKTIERLILDNEGRPR